MSVKTFGYINILVSPSMFFEVNSCYYFFLFKEMYINVQISVHFTILFYFVQQLYSGSMRTSLLKLF